MSFTVVVNAREQAALSALAPSARVEVVPCGVDVDYLKPPSPPTSSREVVFCGVMNYRPNEEGAIWLAQEVWPLVRARCSDATLTIVGAQPTSRVLALAEADRSVAVTGTVPDVRPYLWRAAIAAAPLHIAHGVQTKVLESVAAGLPTVITGAVAAGLPADVLRACLVAETAEEFAAALVSGLMCSPGERRCLVERAGNLDSLRWTNVLTPLGDLLEEAIRAR
jgi:glycosyltransferase involved in cell wall biosynthesis